MGRIKTQFIKRLTPELFKKNREQFKENFNENKPLVDSMLTRPTKKVRNVIAGYLTRLAKKKEEFL
jgi:small subunit ribosomal protein S17e